MAPQSRIDPRDSVEKRLAVLAAEAHGVVSRRELLDAAITPAQIKSRLRVGSLIRVHPGVYRVGHSARNLEARYMAAVKACTVEPLLGGAAGGYLLRLLRGAPPPPEVWAGSEHQIAGVITHRRRVDPSDRWIYRGVPVTSVPRTIVHLAAFLPPPELARSVHQANVIHGTEPDEIEKVLARRHNWKGCRALRRVLFGDERVTVSRMESEFLRTLGAARLPLPRTNVRAGGRLVDCRWPDRALTIELDSYRYHRSRHAWEHDRRREREAYARGDEFRRYTYDDVFERPGPMLRELRKLLPKDDPG